MFSCSAIIVTWIAKEIASQERARQVWFVASRRLKGERARAHCVLTISGPSLCKVPRLFGIKRYVTTPFLVQLMTLSYRPCQINYYYVNNVTYN